MPPPQLPTRPQETQRQISLQPLRVPQLQPAATTDVAAIFASVLKGTLDLTNSIVEADKKVADSFHVDLDINLAKAATAVETERLLAVEEGRPARSDRDILREQFGDNRDNLNSMIRSIGRGLASQKAGQIEADWISGKNKEYGPLFREARIEAESLFADDEVRKEGYLDRLVETETSINQRLIQQQLDDARVTLAADQLNVVNVTVVADTNSYFAPDGALIQRGDEAEPFYIHKNALGAYAKLTWNKTWDELSNGQQAQAVAFTIPQMFQAIAEIPNIKPESKDELLDRYAKGVREDPDLSLEFKKILRKERKNYDALSVATTNKAYTDRRNELSSAMKLVETLPAFNQMFAVMEGSFDPQNKEGFGRIPMGIDLAGNFSYSGPIDANIMNNLEKEFNLLKKKWKRNFDIESRITKSADPGIRPSTGTLGDHDYVNSTFKERQETMNWQEALVATVEHFGAGVGITELMISDMNARALGPDVDSVIESLDGLFKLDPRVAHNLFLTSKLDPQLLDDWNMMRLAQLSSSEVISARKNSRFGGADFDAIKADVATRTADLDLPGRDIRASADAKRLHTSSYRFHRRLGYDHGDAEDAADRTYTTNTIEAQTRGYKQVIVPLPVGKDPRTGETVWVRDEQGDVENAYREVADIVDLISEIDRWQSFTTVDLQQVRLSEDGRNWVFNVVEDDPNADGLQTARPVAEINIPRDDRGRLQLKRELQNVFKGKHAARRAQRAAGGGSLTPEQKIERLKSTMFGLPGMLKYDAELAKTLPKYPAFFPELREQQGQGRYR